MLIHEAALVLAAKTYLTFLNLPFQTKEVCNAPDMSPTGTLPLVRCGSALVSGLDGVMRLAKAKLKTSLTEHLPPCQLADMHAYLSMVQNTLGNALLYFTWMDNNVYKGYTKGRAGSVFNFPLNIIQPWSQWREVHARLEVYNWNKLPPEEAYING